MVSSDSTLAKQVGTIHLSGSLGDDDASYPLVGTDKDLKSYEQPQKADVLLNLTKQKKLD